MEEDHIPKNNNGQKKDASQWVWLWIYVPEMGRTYPAASASKWPAEAAGFPNLMTHTQQ